MGAGWAINLAVAELLIHRRSPPTGPRTWHPGSPGRFLMNRSAPQSTGSFELRIGGHLDHHWSDWFAGLTLTYDEDGSTTLRGTVTDQAELHSLITKVRDLGVTLLSVRTIDADG